MVQLGMVEEMHTGWGRKASTNYHCSPHAKLCYNVANTVTKEFCTLFHEIVCHLSEHFGSRISSLLSIHKMRWRIRGARSIPADAVSPCFEIVGPLQTKPDESRQNRKT